MAAMAAAAEDLICMDGTYLTVPFEQKDQAKARGARWDGAARRVVAR